MLTISSVSVSPWPQAAPSNKVQSVSATKTSHAVSPENAGVAVAVSAPGEVAAVQSSAGLRVLPPVSPTAEAAQAVVWSNAAVPERSGVAGVAQAVVPRQAPDRAGAALPPESGAAAEVVGLGQPVQTPPSTQAAQAEASQPTRYKGELPPDYQPPEQVALETQINELLPNLWKASRAAVDILIGEEAKAAAQARMDAFAGPDGSPAPPVTPQAQEATDTYVAQSGQGAGKAEPGQVVNTQA